MQIFCMTNCTLQIRNGTFMILMNRRKRYVISFLFCPDYNKSISIGFHFFFFNFQHNFLIFVPYFSISLRLPVHVEFSP